MKKYKIIICIFLGFSISTWIAISIFDRHYDKKVFKTILKITEIPKSVKGIYCKSPLIPTDVVTTCYAEVAPSEFNSLLAGYSFKETEIKISSHKYPGLGKIVGEEFMACSEFLVNPTSFVHGGHVIVLSNIERTKILVDLYEE